MNHDDDELDRNFYANAALREEELQVLESIYPDYIVESSFGILKLEVPVELGRARKVIVDSVSGNNADSGANTSTPIMNGNDAEEAIEVSHLPSVLLSISLSHGYPSTSPPSIVSIFPTNSWLLDTSSLVDTLRKTWSAGEGVLCEWVELIRSGEFLTRMNLTDGDDTIRLSYPAPQMLSNSLLTNDQAMVASEFDQQSFSCSICFTALKGSRCILLSCSHVFCRSCLQEYWSLSITEGSIEKVGCPDPGCVKKGREAVENEVRRVVNEDELQRWKWLRVKKAVEKDPTIVHCPIPMCQAAVPRPADIGSEESGWGRFRSCPGCGYNFCSFCKHTWHGPVVECPKSVIHGLVLRYLELAEGSEERVALERRFGQRVILRLVKEYEEEASTKEWLENSTTACPGCAVHVEKSVGCNHMTCAKCSQHFCYRCGAKLDSFNPYTHFSVPGSPCYGKLFEYEHHEDDEAVFLRAWQPML